jgi:NADP-dependent 3-hydroxy acid dehydrogenase YdfG
MESLHGKTAIITGGTTGIGKAIGDGLRAAGVHVVAASRRTGCDVRKKSDVAKLIHDTGRVDILINNTGIGVGSKIADCTEEDWHRVLDTNLTGTFLMMQAVLPSMIAQRSGYIINIASQAAKHGYPNAGPYCAAKFGIVGLSEALQHEVREFGIHVHCLCPGLVQVPAPQNESEVRPGVLQVEDLASVTLFLLKQPRRVQLENIGLFHF